MARPYSVSPRRHPMGDPPTRSIESVAWMERNLDTSVSSVYIDDKKIIAGDWDGMLKCWSRDGDKLWEAELGNRVAGIQFSKNESMLWCIAGRDALGLDYQNGEIKWKIEFDGSTDLINLDDESRAWIISSVYDIELNDFIESTISLIDVSGNVVHQHILDERPWSIHPISRGVSIFGLGRPRGGILKITESQNGFDENHKSVNNAPMLCGSNSIPYYLGQSNGMIIKISEDVTETSILHEFEASIIDIENYDTDIIVALNDHQVIVLDKNGSIVSEKIIGGKPEKIKTLAENKRYWISTLSNGGSTLELIDETHKIVVKILAKSRIRDISHSNGISVVGLDDGRVIAIEQNMLDRRVDEGQQTEQDEDIHRSDMRERLRKLRK
jgi:hypothetical protein